MTYDSELDTAIQSTLRELETRLNTLELELTRSIAQNTLDSNRIIELFSVLIAWVNENTSVVDPLGVAAIKQFKDSTITPADNELLTEIKRSLASVVNAEVIKTQASVLNANTVSGDDNTALLAAIASIILLGTRTIKQTYSDGIANAGSAFVFRRSQAQGVSRWRYSGGLIGTSRPFCQTHSGMTHTLEEITDIWGNNTWAGKAPGNPFVVRGGYNCRHHWVPVE